MFPPEGEVALMFLKHMQMFCGVMIDPSRPIKDGKIVSAIRNRLARLLDIKQLQRVLYDRWQPQLHDKDLCMTDATCYESHLRFPTDVKLLWECCQWVHELLKKTGKGLGERLPRSKYNDVDKARLSYAKQRKHKKSDTCKLLRRLLNLLKKLLGQWNKLVKQHTVGIVLTAEQHKRLSACREVMRQQRDLFNKREVKHRIVSIDRPYLRPIIRGKENKRVEFGAKCKKGCIEYQQALTGIMVQRVGADTIYATNMNRTYCTTNHITTNFVRKGPKPKDENKTVSATRRIIGNLRATVMEGSFGNQKLHFTLARVAARNRWSETMLIFFGIHMANATTLAARKLAQEQNKKQKRRRA